MAVIVPTCAHSLFTYRVSRAEYEPTYAMCGQYQTDVLRRSARGPAQLLVACVTVGVGTFRVINPG